MSEEEETYDLGEIWGKIREFCSDKRVQWFFTILVLFIVTYMGANIRLSNLSLLKDRTSGEYIPLALDPFYFLRVAETKVAKDGMLPEVDVMRSPGMEIPWSNEILPDLIIAFFTIGKLFSSDLDLRFVGILSPVILFIFGTVLFFCVSFLFTRSKVTSLLALALISFSPSYLYRSMAGFVDHDIVGMVVLFFLIGIYFISLKKFEESWLKTVIYAILTGFTISLVLLSWGGLVTFVFLILPVSFILFWFFSKKNPQKSIAYYLILVISMTTFPIFFGFDILNMINRMLSSYGLLMPLACLLIIVDFLVENLEKKKKLKIIHKYGRVVCSVAITLMIGLLSIKIMGKSLIELSSDIWVKLFNPFTGGAGRLGKTVAENAQPYLVSWIGQNGKVIFWLFFLGMLFVGFKFSKTMRKSKNQLILFSSFAFLLVSVLLTRISPSSLLNGENFISQLIYILGLLSFILAFIYCASKNNLRKVEAGTVLLAAIAIVSSVYGRSASRIFFLVAPFVSLFAAIAVKDLWDLISGSTLKDQTYKLISWVILLILVFGVLGSINTNYNSISVQTKNTGPSAGPQWQSAMKWVRDNTSENSIFIHWWDYGYWIQSLGKRPTVTDGGHSGQFQADHYIGRYVLTTPEPRSALSYMKTWNASYLLIDPTDLGKYSAYSSIGGGKADSQDRFSVIPVMVADPKQVQETSNGRIIVFTGGSYIFEDINYDNNGSRIFLPSQRAAIVGVLAELINRNNSQNTIGQPIAIYHYNGNQFRIPLRYAEIEDNLIDYGAGLNAVAKFIPSFDGQRINPLGAVVYISQKVSSGLFGQLYLLNDSFDRYPTLRVAHDESDPVVVALRNSGYSGGEFLYFQGFRGPIRIWEVDYPAGTEIIEKFRDPLKIGGDGDYIYGMFDEIFY